MSFALRAADDTPTRAPAARLPTVLAVTVEPGRLAAGIVDSDGIALVRDRIAIPPRDVWRGLEGLIRRVLAACPANVLPPHAVGASCTGPIDLDAGAVSPYMIDAWRGFPLAAELEALTGLPVHLDSRAAARADALRWTGSAGEHDSFLTVILDATIESACVVRGVRLRGAHGNAASLAHVVVEPDGQECWCGARGCVGAYVSTAAIEREVGRPLRRAPESIVERTGILLGRAIASALALLDVTTVFVSGGLVDVFGDPMLERMQHELGQRARLPHLRELRTIEEDEPCAGLVAAAALTNVPHRV